MRVFTHIHIRTNNSPSESIRHSLFYCETSVFTILSSYSITSCVVNIQNEEKKTESKSIHIQRAKWKKQQHTIQQKWIHVWVTVSKKRRERRDDFWSACIIYYRQANHIYSIHSTLCCYFVSSVVVVYRCSAALDIFQMNERTKKIILIMNEEEERRHKIYNRVKYILEKKANRGMCACVCVCGYCEVYCLAYVFIFSGNVFWVFFS